MKCILVPSGRFSDFEQNSLGVIMLDTSVDIKSGLSTIGHVDKYFGLVTGLSQQILHALSDLKPYLGQ